MAAAKDYRVALGANIRQARRRAEFTQEKLPEKAGLSTNFLGSVERGEDNASVATLERWLPASPVVRC
jgi:transcriptional regulator with XRE-family HTH domain